MMLYLKNKSYDDTPIMAEGQTEKRRAKANKWLKRTDPTDYPPKTNNLPREKPKRQLRGEHPPKMGSVNLPCGADPKTQKYLIIYRSKVYIKCAKTQ